jgi:hypothetical protein
MATPLEAVQTTPTPTDAAVDGWAGLTDPAERRRRQNRINQRAHRTSQPLLRRCMDK